MTGSLASVHPELIPEWSEKNLPLTPDKITFGSNKRVWWKGACGHEWETSVKARSKGEKCPICSGARVIEGINDLATLKPLLAQEWSEKNKLKPTEISVASHKKIIWKCKHGHEWEASVKSRTINGTGCPQCKLPVHPLEACAKVRCLCHGHHAECGRLASVPHGKNDAGKLRVHRDAQSGIHGQIGACEAVEHLGYPAFLYHQCRCRSRTYQGRLQPCSVCQ